jgi:hypothetical protein
VIFFNDEHVEDILDINLKTLSFIKAYADKAGVESAALRFTLSLDEAEKILDMQPSEIYKFSKKLAENHLFLNCYNIRQALTDFLESNVIDKADFLSEAIHQRSKQRFRLAI